MSRYAFALLGIGFGFLLSRAGATSYDYYAGLFLFRDFQLLWVIATAAAVGAVGLRILQRTARQTVFGDGPVALTPKPWRKGLWAGALLLGVGWGLAGACPGTVMAMLGEGKLGAVFTIIGIALGTYLYGALQPTQAEPREPL